MKTTKIGVLFLALLVGMAGIVTPTMAATEDEIQNSIDKGVIWLLGQQNSDGSWGSWDQVARTGFALVKLEDRSREKGFEPLDPKGPYYGAITKGLGYLMTQKNNEDITGDLSDKNGNNNAISFNSGGGHQTYHTGIALMAIANSGGAVYATDIQDIVDWFIKYQNPDGGWRYTGNNQPSDNSNTGYAALGIGYAQQYGANIGDIKTGLSSWVDYIQNDVNGDTDDGGSGYTGPNDGWINILKTGNLIFEAGLVGDAKDSQRVKDAVDYIVRHWLDNNADPGWRPHHYQAMYAAMKGLESLKIEKIGSAPEIDWYAEFSDAIVASQNLDGSWPVDNWGDVMLSTEWALLTLEKVTIIPVYGFMTGGGSVFTKDGVRVTHGFELDCDKTQAPNNLEVNWGKNNKFHLDTLDSATCIDDLAIEPNPPVAGFDTYKGTGTGKYNGIAGATAEWKFTDAGEPGKEDTATIEIKDKDGKIVLTVSGKLDKGNQQAHKPKEK